MGLFARTARVLAANPGAFAGPVALVVGVSWLPALLGLLGVDWLGWPGLALLGAVCTASMLPMLHLYRVALGCLRGDRPRATPLQTGLQLVSMGLSSAFGVIAVVLMLFPSAWAFPMVFVEAAVYDTTGGFIALAVACVASLALAYPAIYVAVRWQFAWLVTLDQDASAVPALSRSFLLAGTHVRTLLWQAALAWSVTGVATVLTCGLGAAPCMAGILVLQAVTYEALSSKNRRE